MNEYDLSDAITETVAHAHVMRAVNTVLNLNCVLSFCYWVIHFVGTCMAEIFGT